MKFDEHECLKWCFGNLLSNSIRAKVAEFIVAKALDVANDLQQGWDAFDLNYRDAGIEVKSSAYLQSWEQAGLSKIVFDIAPRTHAWNAYKNAWVSHNHPKRAADVYVFCLFTEVRREVANPLDTDQWVFHVLSRATIDENWGMQKTVSYGPVKSSSEAMSFEHIRVTVDKILSNG